MNNNVLSDEMSLLVNNVKLDRMYLLIIIYYLNKKPRIQQLTIELIQKYFVLSKLKDTSENITYGYLERLNERIPSHLIHLYNLGFIQVIGNMNMDRSKLIVDLTDAGENITVKWIKDELLNDRIEGIASVVEKNSIGRADIIVKKIIQGN